MARGEMLHIAERGLLLTMPGALRLTAVAARIVQTTGGLDKGPLYSEAISMLPPQGTKVCSAWFRARIDPALPYGTPQERRATGLFCEQRVNAILGFCNLCYGRQKATRSTLAMDFISKNTAEKKSWNMWKVDCARWGSVPLVLHTARVG